MKPTELLRNAALQMRAEGLDVQEVGTGVKRALIIEDYDVVIAVDEQNAYYGTASTLEEAQATVDKVIKHGKFSSVSWLEQFDTVIEAQHAFWRDYDDPLEDDGYELDDDDEDGGDWLWPHVPIDEDEDDDDLGDDDWDWEDDVFPTS